MAEESGKVSVSEVLNKNVRKFGPSLVANLFIAVKTAKLYSLEHTNAKDAVQNLAKIINFFVENEGEMNLGVMGEYLFMNEVRLKMDLGGYETFMFVVREFQARQIGALSVKSDIQPAEVEKFVTVFNKVNVKAPYPFEEVMKLVEEAGLEDIQLAKYEQTEVELKVQNKNPSIEAFFKTVSVLQGVELSVTEGKRLNIKRAKRAIQSIVDVVLTDEYTVLALTRIQDLATYYIQHSTNVAILGIVLGHRLGLRKKKLGELGMTALFHDLGMTMVPKEIITKAGSLDEEEWEEVQRHPLQGAQLLLRSDRIVDVVVRSMQVCLQHALRNDLSGYPKLRGDYPLNLYTKIIAICDAYQAMTSPRAYRERPYTPEEAIRELLRYKDTWYDGLILKVFVNMMGIYPVGSLVQMDTGEMATVLRPNPDTNFIDRPTVKIFSDEGGDGTSAVIDLMEKDPSGRFRRSVSRVFEPDEINLEVNEYLSIL